MGFLDRLLRRGERTARRGASPTAEPPTPDRDAAVIMQYRYLLRTAPPEAMEQAHAEAFVQLTSEQRRQVLTSLGRELPDAAWARSYDPHSLARLATRAEIRRPGTLVRTFGRIDPGTLLPSVAGAFLGTAVADALLPDDLDLSDHDAFGVPSLDD